MKKLLFLTAIITVVTLTASAQVKLKLEPAESFVKKASSAIKSTAGKQQTMRAIKPGEECGVFTETKKDDKGGSYNVAKEFLIISNDGVTGFGFTFFTTTYEGKKLVVMRGLPLENGVCVDNTTKITFTFEDGETATLSNFEKDNCKGLVTMYFGEILKNTTILDKLTNSKVRSIKLVAVEKTVVKSLSEGNQQQLQGTLKCL